MSMSSKATGTTEALWAVAEMAQEAPMLQALLPVLVFRLAKTARQLTSEAFFNRGIQVVPHRRL